jgi:hypothetical protein
MGEEQVWTKRGSRIHLPRLPGLSRATLLRAIPVLGVASLSLIGLLAVPAGSPPPPPAVAAAPITSSTPEAVQLPTPEPSPTEITFSDPDPPHCTPRAHAVVRTPAAGTIVYTDIEHEHVFLYDRTTGKRTLVLDGTGSCGFLTPRFLDAQTLAYNLSSAYIREQGSFTVNMTTGKMQRTRGSKRDWPWLVTSAISPDGAKLAELGSLDQAHSFTLRVTSRRTGAQLFSRSMGYICYCDGGLDPIEVRWSPDSAYLLVAVPGETTATQLFLINAKGQDVRKPIAGAYPRWIAGTHSFIYRGAQTQWLRVDALTSKPAALFQMRSVLADPAFSPDSTKIAFWDTAKLNIVVYDFSTTTFSRYGDRRAYPLWLDNGTIVASGVLPCNCEGYGFEFTGFGYSITLRTNGTHRIMVQTFDADVLR